MTDRYGHRDGSKKALACELYEREHGATTNEIRHKLGGSQVNLLYDVAARGHKVEQLHRYCDYAKRNVTAYIIRPNHNVPWGGGRVNFKTVSLDELETTGFKPREVNEIMTVWMVPTFLHKALPKGLKMFHIFNNRVITRVVGEGPGEWNDYKGWYPDREQKRAHLDWGVLPASGSK